MRFIAHFMVLSSVIFAAGCSKTAPSASISGCVVFIKGSVTVTRGASPSVPAVGFPINENDVVETGAESIAVIQLSDRDVLRISPESKMIMSSIVRSDKIRLRLEKGELASKVTKLSKGDVFEVHTPTVVAAVRGTEFAVSVTPKEEKISVLTGKVEVTGAEGKEAAVKQNTADAGKTVVVNASGPQPTVEIRDASGDETDSARKASGVQLLPDLNRTDGGALDLKRREIDVIESAESAEAPKPAALQGTKEEKIRQLIAEKPASIDQIKEVFERIDEVSLYSGRVIRGAIISRGTTYSILTTGGVVNVPESQVRTVKVVR